MYELFLASLGLYVFIGGIFWLLMIARFHQQLGVKMLIFSVPGMIFGWPYFLYEYRDLLVKGK